MSKCEYFQLNHQDFTCETCNKDFLIRDDSKLNICFSCKELYCDNCFDDHLLENDERYNFKMYGKFMYMIEKDYWEDNLYRLCDGGDFMIDDENELISYGDGLKIIVKNGKSYLSLK